MNKRIWKLAALCLALCLALTGCNLIAIDPIQLPRPTSLKP